MRRANHQYEYQIGDDAGRGSERKSRAEIRTFDGRWVGDAQIESAEVGQHDSSDDARAALVRTLRSLADAVERDG